MVRELIVFDDEANLKAALVERLLQAQMRPVLRGYGLSRPPISAYHTTVCKHTADAVN